MSLAKKIIGNTFIQMFWRITTALMAIIAVKLITSTLWVDWYWTYAVVYEFLALFAVAWDFGIYTVALREMSEKLNENSLWKNNWENLEQKKLDSKKEKNNGFFNKKVSFIYQNILWLRITLMAIFMIIAVISAFLIPKYQWTLIPMWILISSVAVFLNLVNSIAGSILQLHLKMTYATIWLIIGKIVSISIILYWAFFVESNTTAFFIFLIAGIFWHFVMLWISLFYAKKYSDIFPKFNFEYWIEIFKKAAPYWVALILWTIYFKVDVFLLSLLKNTDEVWIYAVWIRIIEVFTVLPMFFMNSILPSLTKTIENNWKKIDEIMQLCFNFMLLTGLPLVIWTFLVSKFIIWATSSPEFLSWARFELWADVVLYLLMTAMFFSFFSTFISILMVAFKKPKLVLFINLIWVILNLILNLIYIPKYWYISAALTSILSELLIVVLWFILIQKIHKFTPNFLSNFKIIFSWILMFFVWFFLKKYLWEWNYQSILIILICWITYSFLIWKLKIVDKSDFLVLRK